MLAVWLSARMRGLALLASLLSLSLGGCAHTTDEKRKSEFENHAENRIETMEKNVKELQERQREQLGGTPKQQLTASINELQSTIDLAKAELKELKARDPSTWVEKKGAVDKYLYEMDQTYNNALAIFEAH